MVGLLTLLHVTVPAAKVPDVAELCHDVGKLRRMYIVGGRVIVGFICI